mmetsp:Transcript_18746/g.28784  ORF Transcript_18746/g.28784 Transcript_18746/m.28784 type:complete len:118 (+) Transcript_18746:189-542(+)
MDAWVAIPEYIFEVPNPLQVDRDFKSALRKLRKVGFSGNNVVIVGHSLGGVIAQNYIASNPDASKAMILLGSTIYKKYLSINEDGSSKLEIQTPTLTLAGEKDGLMRISRGAVAYWH